MNSIYISQEEEQRYAELQLMALESARAGDIELLKSMIQAGMPVNLCDPKGNSLLMLAGGLQRSQQHCPDAPHPWRRHGAQKGS